MRAIRAQDEGHEGDEGDEGGRGHEMRAMRAMRAMRSRRDEGDEDDDEGDGRQLGGFDDGGQPACGFPAAGCVALPSCITQIKPFHAPQRCVGHEI